MDFLQAIIIAIVEGLTEYLPISSTGHMILTEWLLGIHSDDFVKFFTVNIQLGAILAVLVVYWRKFLPNHEGWFMWYLKIGVAFIPAAVMGLLFNDVIDEMLESPLTVAISLVLGGIVLLFVDQWFQRESDEPLTFKSAFWIGCCQVLAMIPGVSRSGASIVGGMSAGGLTRASAAEFSFFLAVPTMLGATAKKTYDFWKDGNEFSSEQLQLLGLGNVVAFIVALLAIRFFIGFLQKYGFKMFGWYRIVLGCLILLWLALGG